MSTTDGGQPRKRKWDVPGPAAIPIASLPTAVGQTPAAGAATLNIAAAQAAAAAIFNKYHPVSSKTSSPLAPLQGMRDAWAHKGSSLAQPLPRPLRNLQSLVETLLL